MPEGRSGVLVENKDCGSPSSCPYSLEWLEEEFSEVRRILKPFSGYSQICLKYSFASYTPPRSITEKEMMKCTQTL